MVLAKGRVVRRRTGPVGGASHDAPPSARRRLPRGTAAPPPPDGPGDDATVMTSNRSADDGGDKGCSPASLGVSPDGSVEVVIDTTRDTDAGEAFAPEASRILGDRTSRGEDSGGDCDTFGVRTTGLWIKCGERPLSSDACAVITPSTIGSGDGSKAMGYDPFGVLTSDFSPRMRMSTGRTSSQVPPCHRRHDKVITNLSKMAEDRSVLRRLASTQTECPDDDSADSVEYLLAWCGVTAPMSEDPSV